MAAVFILICTTVFALCEGPRAGLSHGRLRMEPRAFLQSGLASTCNMLGNPSFLGCHSHRVFIIY